MPKPRKEKLTPQERQEIQESFQIFITSLSGKKSGNRTGKPTISNATLKFVNSAVRKYMKLKPQQQKRFLLWYGSVLEELFVIRYMNRALKKAA
jgi:hypothetical protein